MPVDTTDNQLLGFFRTGHRRILDPLVIVLGVVACVLASLYLENVFARVAVCIVASLCTIGAMIWVVMKNNKRKQADEENMVHLPSSPTLPQSPEDEPEADPHSSPILQRHHSKRCSQHHGHHHHHGNGTERRCSYQAEHAERRHSHCPQHEALLNHNHSPDSPECPHSPGSGECSLAPHTGSKRCSRHGSRSGSRSPRPGGSPRPSQPDIQAESPEATEPATTEPAASKPAATEPAATKPAATEPAATKPAATEPATATKPTAEPTTATEPATADLSATVEPPAAGEPATAEA